MAVQLDDTSEDYSSSSARRRSSLTAASNADSSNLDSLEGFSELELDDIDTAAATAAATGVTSPGCATAVTVQPHHRSSSSASSSSVNAASAGSPSRAARHSSISSRPEIDGGLAAKLKTLTSFKLPDVSTAAATTAAAAGVGAGIHGGVGGSSDQQLGSPTNSSSSSVPLPLAAKLERAEATLAEGWDSVEASVDGMLARARAAIAAKRPPLHPSPAAAAAAAATVVSPSQQQQQQHERSGSAFSVDSAETAEAAVAGESDGQESTVAVPAAATPTASAAAKGPNAAAALSGLRASFSESVRRLSEHSAHAGTGGHSYSHSGGSATAAGGGSGSPTAVAAAVAGRHNSGASSVGGLNAMRASFSERVRRVSAAASTAVAAATAVDSATAATTTSSSSSSSSSRPSVGAALQERMEKLRSSVQAVLDGDGELGSAAIVAAAPLPGEVGAPQQRTAARRARGRTDTDDDDFWDPFQEGSSTKQQLASVYSSQPQQQQQRKPADRR
jgi:trimeric autotransporter adhesin